MQPNNDRPTTGPTQIPLDVKLKPKLMMNTPIDACDTNPLQVLCQADGILRTNLDCDWRDQLESAFPSSSINNMLTILPEKLHSHDTNLCHLNFKTQSSKKKYTGSLVFDLDYYRHYITSLFHDSTAITIDFSLPS